MHVLVILIFSFLIGFVSASDEGLPDAQKKHLMIMAAIEAKGEKLNLQSICFTPDDSMTCGDLLDYTSKMEEIASRPCDIELKCENFSLIIANYALKFNELRESPNLFSMYFQDKFVKMNAVSVMMRNKFGKLQKVEENVGKIQSVDPAKPRFLYIMVMRQTKIMDIMTTFRELKFEPFALSFLIFYDLNGRAL